MSLAQLTHHTLGLEWAGIGRGGEQGTQAGGEASGDASVNSESCWHDGNGMGGAESDTALAQLTLPPKALRALATSPTLGGPWMERGREEDTRACGCMHTCTHTHRGMHALTHTYTHTTHQLHMLTHTPHTHTSPTHHTGMHAHTHKYTHTHTRHTHTSHTPHRHACSHTHTHTCHTHTHTPPTHCRHACSHAHIHTHYIPITHAHI